jgi:hypothetical protein
MQPLHDSNDNMGLWKWAAEDDRLCLRYDGVRARFHGIFAGVACLAFASLLAWLSRRAEQAQAPFWIIGVLTSVVVVFIFIRRAGIEEGKGDILQVHTTADIVLLPRDATTVHRAKDRLQFSYELQWRSERYNSELNYVLDGKRRPLLAQLGTGAPLADIARRLSELGFTVTRYESPKEEPNQSPEPMPLKRHGSS